MTCVGSFLHCQNKGKNHTLLFLVLATLISVLNLSEISYISSHSDANVLWEAEFPLDQSISSTYHSSVKNLPTFVLHIGPHKSATTSIQCSLHRYRKELRELDSIVFLGKVDGRHCQLSRNEKVDQDQRIQKLPTCMRDPDCWLKLTNEWEYYRRNGSSLILSKEGMSDLASANHSLESERADIWPALEKALGGWNVTIVVAYRRFFDWLPSAFNQHAFHMRLQARERWPTFPSMPHTVTEVAEGVVRGDMPPPYPFVDAILEYPFPRKWKVHVMNMHQTNDVVRAFLCEEILQDASHTCSVYEPSPLFRKSPSEDLIYDYLNVQALHWGWMTADRPRGERGRTTRRFAKQVLQLTPGKLPMTCPSKSILYSLLSFSIAMEQRILGSVNVVHHSKEFWKSSRNFCTVNATAVLLANASAWKKFYR